VVVYFICFYENSTVKLVEIVLSAGEDYEGGTVTVGVNLTKVHCKHVWKCHNETSCTTNIC
jgi:hypothetical protein